DEIRGAVFADERPLDTPREAGEPRRMLLHLLPARLRLALLPSERGRREEAAEVLVAGAILDQEPEVAGTRDRHLGADERPDARLPGRLEEARRAVDAVPIGERQRVVLERRGARDQVLGQRRAGEKAERAPAAELDVISHRPRPRTTAPPPVHGSS